MPASVFSITGRKASSVHSTAQASGASVASTISHPVRAAMCWSPVLLSTHFTSNPARDSTSSRFSWPRAASRSYSACVRDENMQGSDTAVDVPQEPTSGKLITARAARSGVVSRA